MMSHGPRLRERRETLAYWPAKNAENGKAVGLVSNLTEDGIQILSKHGFRKGQMLAIQISVITKLAGADHISLVIKNVWSRASGISGLYHSGFRIVDMSDVARGTLINLINSFSYPAPQNP